MSVMALFASAVVMSHGLFAGEKTRVGIYKEDMDGLSTYGEKGMFDALKETDDIEPRYLSEISTEALKDFDVLIISKRNWNKTDYRPDDWKEDVRNWVRGGHGVMCMHETAGCTVPRWQRHYQWDLFPEIGKGFRVVQGKEIVMVVGHPITKNAAPNQVIPNQVFRQSFSDHMTFYPGKASARIAYGIRVDEPSSQFVMDNPVILAGTFEKGRVILNGMLLGFDEETGLEKSPEKAERHLLLDGVRWLASRQSDKKVSSANAFIGAIIGPSDGVWREGPDGLMLVKGVSAASQSEADQVFLKPILAKVNPPALSKDIGSLSVGIVKHEDSGKWLDALKNDGCGNVREISENDFEDGLQGVSVLIVGDTPVNAKYVPVIKNFIGKGGKLIAAGSAGFDTKTGKYNLADVVFAGKHINTIGVEYFSMIMPEEFRRKEIDKRRADWIVNRFETAYKNGADGMAYFTVDQLFKPEAARLDENTPNGAIQNWNSLEDYGREVGSTISNAPLWKKEKELVLSALPDIPQIGFVILRHTQVMDLNAKQIAEECKDSGINIVTVQEAYLDRMFLPEHEKDNITKLRETYFERIGPELGKRGISLWVNVFPSRGISKEYCTSHPDETKIDSQGKNTTELCPVKNGKGFKYNLEYLERVFSKYPYLSGISLDEPSMKVNECFCDACKALFAQKFPAGKMDVNSDDFRKFREYIWCDYYVKPYAELLRRHRPVNGVLMLAAPGIQKAWGMSIDGLSGSGIQVFANENAQTQSDLKFHDYWARYSLDYFPCTRTAFVKKHPLLKKTETISVGGKAVAVDIFKGAETLAYVSDGSRSYPGIVVANDTSTVYFSFNPLDTPNLIANTLHWFIENDRHDVPRGMAVIPAGNFSMKTPKDDPVSTRFPEDMVTKETFVGKFYLDIVEVANREYEKYDPNHKRGDLSAGDDMPVVNVSMNDAKKYCNWMSVSAGLSPVYTPAGNNFKTDLSKNGYRLPTVAEWQKAAAGSERNRYSWGNHYWKASGRVGMDFSDGAAATGSYRPNYYGIYDMTGNVWEWCEDYEAFPKRQGRICGGAWHNDERECDVCFYNFLYENHTRSTIGFRCARNADERGGGK